MKFKIPENALLYILFTAMGVACFTPIQSRDLWWHLASGRYIVQQMRVPFTDPFSFTCRGSPWVDSYWLIEILFYAFYRAWNLVGVMLLKTLLILIALVIPERRLQRMGVPAVVRGLAVAAIFMGSHPRGYGWGEQASLITFVFLSLLFSRLEEKSVRQLWIWPLLFALWANMHRGFVLGLVVLFFYVIDRLLQDSDPLETLAWGLCCGAATLLNPYGWRLYTMVVDDLKLSPTNIAGWHSTPWGHVELFWILLAGFFGSFFFVRQEPGHRRVFHGLTASFLALGATRYVVNVPYFVLFAVPYGVQRVWTGWRPSPSSHAIRRAGLFAVVSAAIVYSLLEVPATGKIDPSIFPIDACDFIARNNFAGRFYNDYGFGGYWIWRFFPDRGVFIDGRYPAVLGYQALFRETMQAREKRPADWLAFLAKYDVQGALLSYPAHAPMPAVFSLYFPRQQWALVYWDDTALVFYRRSPAADPQIKRWEFPTVAPEAGADYLRAQTKSSPRVAERLMNDLQVNQRLHPDSQRVKSLMEALKSSGAN